MNIHEFGSAASPAVVLLHGTPSAASDWFPVAKRLAPSYRVFVPELPGYGASPAPEKASYEAVDSELVAALIARGVERLRGLVGFSSGAYRAFEIVLRGRLVADVIIALGAIAASDEEASAGRRQLGHAIASDAQFVFGPELRSLVPEVMLSPAWRTAHPEDAERVIGWLHLSPPAALAAELIALADMPDLRPELPQLTAKVYLRVGEHDAAAPPALSEEICRLAPNATLDIVPGCGHSLLIEDLEATTAAIVRALAM